MWNSRSPDLQVKITLCTILTWMKHAWFIQMQYVGCMSGWVGGSILEAIIMS